MNFDLTKAQKSFVGRILAQSLVNVDILGHQVAWNVHQRSLTSDLSAGVMG
jgi:hypothetical protein